MTPQQSAVKMSIFNMRPKKIEKRTLLVFPNLHGFEPPTLSQNVHFEFLGSQPPGVATCPDDFFKTYTYRFFKWVEIELLRMKLGEVKIVSVRTS